MNNSTSFDGPELGLTFQRLFASTSARLSASAALATRRSQYGPEAIVAKGAYAYRQLKLSS